MSKSYVARIGLRDKGCVEIKDIACYVGSKPTVRDLLNLYVSKAYIRNKDSKEVCLQLDDGKWETLDELVKIGRIKLK